MYSINNNKFKSLVGFLKNKYISSQLSSLSRIQKDASFTLRNFDDNSNKLSLLSIFKSVDNKQAKSIAVEKKDNKQIKDKKIKSKINPIITEDKHISILSLNKILSKNNNYSILSHKFNPKLDNYSLSFFKSIDSSFRNSNDNYYNSKYLKKMKVNVIDIFNKQGFYKEFSYSSKDFKKSDLDNCFAMNMHITKNMLKVYCNVFRINLVYKTLESDFQFLTRYEVNNATLVVLEENNSLHTIYNKSTTFIRGTELIDVLEINKKYTEATLCKMKLDELQNIAKKKNKDVKKQGKVSKINKTKDELIKEIMM